MPAAVNSDRNAGKRWSTRDKRDLTEALGRGESLDEAASYFLRPAEEVARMAAELGLLAGAPGQYTTVLFNEGGEGAGVEAELGHENRLGVAHTLYEVMRVQHPGRLVMLTRQRTVVPSSSVIPNSMPTPKNAASDRPSYAVTAVTLMCRAV